MIIAWSYVVIVPNTLPQSRELYFNEADARKVAREMATRTGHSAYLVKVVASELHRPRLGSTDAFTELAG